MVETKATIDKIVSELEDNKPTIPQTGKLSVNQVMEILLDKNIASAENYVTLSVGNSECGFDMRELKRWRDKNNQIYSIKLDRPLYSNRPGIGKIVVFVKKVIRKLIRPILYPILAEQNEFNASVTASVNALYNNEMITQQFIDTQKELNKKVNKLQNEIRSLEEKLKDSNNNLSGAPIESSSYGAIDYARFEANFRGSEEDIKNRQSIYLPYFSGKEQVLDLGCGRGEFLQLLQENGIRAKGIDAYDGFVEACELKGLDVVEGDAIQYIENVDEASLDGIFSAQLIEHISTGELVTLCDEAYKKLKKGGCIILETPNPTCLSIYTNSFYIDPTHVKPVHPKFLEYLLREAGFEKIEVLYTESSKVDYRLPTILSDSVDNLDEFNEGIKVLSDVIFGSQDYAIIATK